LVAQVGIEPTIDQLMRLVSLPRLVRAINGARLELSRVRVLHPDFAELVAEGG